MACSTMSKHVVIAWTHYAFILDMSSWMLYCILGNTTMDACSFCSKFCTYKLCLISKYTVVNCEIYVTNTTAYLSLTSNNAFIYQAIYIKHSSIRLYIKQGIHPSGYTLNRTFIYQISQGHLACGSRSSGGGLLRTDVACGNVAPMAHFVRRLIALTVELERECLLAALLQQPSLALLV